MNRGGYAGGNGGVSSKDIHTAKEMRADIDRLFRSLGALVEDFRVTLGIEVKTSGVLGKPVVVNGPVAEAPMQGVKHEPSVRDDEALCSGKEQKDSNGFDVTKVVSGDCNGQRA